MSIYNNFRIIMRELNEKELALVSAGMTTNILFTSPNVVKPRKPPPIGRID